MDARSLWTTLYSQMLGQGSDWLRMQTAAIRAERSRLCCIKSLLPPKEATAMILHLLLPSSGNVAQGQEFHSSESA